MQCTDISQKKNTIFLAGLSERKPQNYIVLSEVNVQSGQDKGNREPSPLSFIPFVEFTILFFDEIKAVETAIESERTLVFGFVYSAESYRQPEGQFDGFAVIQPYHILISILSYK